jgi:CheY-like chemotaxis protein
MINLHVLFADDDADVRNIVAWSLERDPLFVARGCASGGEALEVAVEWRPDLTLLDVRMPGMDGPTVLARLRGQRHTAAIPVVFLTGRAETKECADLKALGAAGVIPKPFDPNELAAELRRFVPVEGALAAAREAFLLRLDADAYALSLCREWLSDYASRAVLTRIGEIAHALAGAGGIYGFAGISCESSALFEATEGRLAGRAKGVDVERALDRLLRRIRPDWPLHPPRYMPARHSAATA